MKKIILSKLHLWIYSFAILCIAIFSIFSSLYSFQNYQEYILVIRAMAVAVIILVSCLIFAETISLTFDRTATKTTLLLTVSLLLFYIFSNDIIYILHIFQVVNDSVYSVLITYVGPIINNICFLGITYFVLLFYSNDFRIYISKKRLLLAMLGIVIIDILFVIFHVLTGYYIINCLAAICAIFVIFRRLLLTRNMVKSTPASLVFFIEISVILSYLYNTFFSYNFLGISTILFIVIIASYLTIYANFLYTKTIQVYSYEDRQIKNILSEEEKMLITCFHCFDCKFEGKTVEFPSKKSKELFALLIMLRGRVLSMEKAITYLWPDKDLEKSKILYRDAIWKLRKLFQEINFKGVNFKRGMTILNVDYIICDYYQVLDDKIPYNGDPLMPEYDWSMDFENSLIK